MDPRQNVLFHTASFVENAPEVNFLHAVAIPCIAEDHKDSPQARLLGGGPAIYCPSFRHAFSPNESVSDVGVKKAHQELLKAMEEKNQKLVEGTVGPKAKAKNIKKLRPTVNSANVEDADGTVGPEAAAAKFNKHNKNI